MYAFGGKWAATNIHMILGKLSATLGAWKDTAITESLRELSNVRRNMAATGFRVTRKKFTRLCLTFSVFRCSVYVEGLFSLFFPFRLVELLCSE